MEEEIPDRYAANPMLAVVENYILDTLGLLPAEKAALLNTIVCRTFGGTNWRAAVEKELDLPRDSRESILALWKARQAEAEATQSDLAAEDFVREVADEWFRGQGG